MEKNNFMDGFYSYYVGLFVIGFAFVVAIILSFVFKPEKIEDKKAQECKCICIYPERNPKPDKVILPENFTGNKRIFGRKP